MSKAVWYARLTATHDCDPRRTRMALEASANARQPCDGMRCTAMLLATLGHNAHATLKEAEQRSRCRFRVQTENGRAIFRQKMLTVHIVNSCSTFKLNAGV